MSCIRRLSFFRLFLFLKYFRELNLSMKPKRNIQIFELETYEIESEFLKEIK